MPLASELSLWTLFLETSGTTAHNQKIRVTPLERNSLYCLYLPINRASVTGITFPSLYRICINTHMHIPMRWKSLSFVSFYQNCLADITVFIQLKIMGIEFLKARRFRKCNMWALSWNVRMSRKMDELEERGGQWTGGAGLVSTVISITQLSAHCVAMIQPPFCFL